MFLLDWRLTIVALVLLPLFIIPAKRVGPAHAGAHPRGHELRRRHERAHDRAVQRERGPAGQALRRPPPRDRRVLRPRRPGPRHRRAHRACTAGPSSSPSASSAPSAPPSSTGSAASRSSTARSRVGTLVAMAAFVTRIYQPLTAADQRPGRRHDGVRLVRPGLRGARRAQPASTTRRAPSTSSTPTGRIELRRRVVPLPGRRPTLRRSNVARARRADGVRDGEATSRPRRPLSTPTAGAGARRRLARRRPGSSWSRSSARPARARRR